ncbi:replicative DNA helicase [Comamonas odontotermitis]|uniref:DNA 5'-3' helicase n=1 Tax=Comamonas odontotermitis TaxID=379895 RepID=A0ABR6RFP8_9BURK|nr:DnaB-like helicase C-terminal domain-containing protein [Comamonas odontotermitis]MBB6577987.1 replicative DNA helicase [Comamonas odontotermitis]
MQELDQYFGAEPIAPRTDPTQVAEQSVLGALLLAGAEAFDKAAGLLSAASFAHPLNGCIWKAVEELVLSGREVDPVVVLHSLQGKVDEAYNDQLPMYLTSLASASTGRLVEHHARIVANLHRLRRVAAASAEVNELLQDKGLSAEDITSRAMVLFEAIADERMTSEAKSVGELVVPFLDELEDLADGKAVLGRETGIPRLDYALAGGTYDGQLIVIAARPSVGKSSFAQQLALNQAERGYPAAFLGMEMNEQELMRRTVANLSRVPLRLLKTGKLSPDDYGRVPDAMERMRDLPLYFEFCPGANLADISAKARKLVRKHKIKLLVIDYLQLMAATDERKDRRVQLEEITRNLKRLACQLGITIALLSQLNREVEKRSSPKPMLADLKECGAIEEDADIVLALWDHKKGDIDEPSIKGLGAIKGRDLGQSDMALHFEGKYQRWTESTESLAKPESTPTRPHKRYPDDY